MKSRSFVCLFVVALLSLTSSSFAIMLEGMGLREMSQQADLIVRGTVLSTQSRWVNDSHGKHIRTLVVIRVSDTLKGKVSDNVVKLETVGGVVGDMAEEVTDTAVFTRGEEVVSFLQSKSMNVVGGFQGKFEVSNGLVTVDSAQVRVDDFVTAVKALVANPEARVAVPRADETSAGKPGLTVVGEEAGGAAPAEVTNADTTPSSPNLLKATIRDAWWTGAVDNDHDGYASLAKLNWDPNVTGGSGSIAVYEKVYYKSATGTTWTPLYTMPTHTITGTSTADGRVLIVVSGSSHAMWDFKIVVYRNGIATADYTRSNTNDTSLNDFKMEPELVAISGITPGKASAGTNATVSIYGSNFGATQGSYGGVTFFFASDKPKISAPVVSWSNTKIVCRVPTALVNNYPASAGSGPVTVQGSNLSTRDYTFRATFGYGGHKWPGTAPVINYRINQNCASATGEGTAVQAAANTWNNVGSGFKFHYLGATTRVGSSQDYLNDVSWSSTNGSIATTYYWWNSSGALVECDIVFSTAFNWSTAATVPSTRMDVQTIALHELGHWLNLRDLYGNVGDGVYDNGKVMYGFCNNGIKKRTLLTDDRAGILWIY